MKNRCLEGIISTIDRAGNDTRRSAKEQFSKYDLPDVTFITVASHDTASAVLGTPGQGERWGYISSGTWSLLGIETKIANVSRNAFLKIIRMNGVPITRCVFEKHHGDVVDPGSCPNARVRVQLCGIGRACCKRKPLQQVMEINDPRFLNPKI